MLRLITVLVLSTLITGCNQNGDDKSSDIAEPKNISVLQKEIEARLREYENHLKNRDSIALGDMYMTNAEVIPSVVGRKNIIKIFGGMIRYYENYWHLLEC